MLLPPKLVNSLGNLMPLLICIKVNNSVAVIDPLSLRNYYLDAEQYFRVSFKSFLTSKQLVEFVVLDVDLVSFSETHLGHVLNVGDYALGYDLYSANNNNMELDTHKGLMLPEVILVKKSYEKKKQKKRGKPRPWKLKSLNMEVDLSATRGRVDEEKMNADYESSITFCLGSCSSAVFTFRVGFRFKAQLSDGC